MECLKIGTLKWSNISGIIDSGCGPYPSIFVLKSAVHSQLHYTPSLKTATRRGSL